MRFSPVKAISSLIAEMTKPEPSVLFSRAAISALSFDACAFRVLAVFDYLLVGESPGVVIMPGKRLNKHEKLKRSRIERILN